MEAWGLGMSVEAWRKFRDCPGDTMLLSRAGYTPRAKKTRVRREVHGDIR